MVLNEKPHFILPRGVVQLIHLGKETLPEASRSASKRIEAPYRRKNLKHMRFTLAGHHHHVRQRAIEISVVIQVADEGFSKGVVAGRQIGHRNLAFKMIVESLFLYLAVKETLSALHVIFVRIDGRSGLILRHCGGYFAFSPVILRNSIVHRTLQHVIDIFNHGIERYFADDLLTEIGQIHRKHANRLAHGRRQLLRLFLPLLKGEHGALRQSAQGSAGRSRKASGCQEFRT